MLTQLVAEGDTPLAGRHHALLGPSIRLCLDQCHRRLGAGVMLCRYVNLYCPALKQGSRVAEVKGIDLEEVGGMTAILNERGTSVVRHK